MSKKYHPYRKKNVCSKHTLSVIWKTVSLSSVVFLLISYVQAEIGGGIASNSSVLQERNSSIPAGCDHVTYPYYEIKETKNSFALVVDIKNISPKNLSVNVDFEHGIIHVLGWYHSQNQDDKEEQNGENMKSKKKCLNQEWKVDLSANGLFRINLQDVVMERVNDNVIVYLPKPRSTNRSSSTQESDNYSTGIKGKEIETQSTMKNLSNVGNESEGLRGPGPGQGTTNTGTVASTTYATSSDSLSQESERKKADIALVMSVDSEEEEYLFSKV